MGIMYETHLPLKLKRGKVRDNYEIDQDRLLIVSTDRISCFDVVLNEGISGKGRILNQLSAFWFKYLRQWERWRIEDHFLSDDVWSLWIERVLSSRDIDENDLVGRSMIVRRMDKVIPIECVMRAALTGSAWKEYKETGAVCSEELPWQGLKEGDKFPKPIFTPAIKVEIGHDINISRQAMAQILADFDWPNKGKLGEEGGIELTRFLEKFARTVFFLARMYAGSRGIDIYDTKFEFGIKNDKIYLIDEVLTPDSSRFCLATRDLAKREDEEIVNFDKQYVRDWLEQSGWNKEYPAPSLPDYVRIETSRRYQEIYRKLL